MRVSVCLATYNGAKYIAEQLQSIVCQLGPGDEIIVSDDGSTDGTPNVVRQMGIACLRLVCNQGERGYTGNFENALRHASGDVIFLSDQDDVWMPHKVEKCLEALREAPFVVSDARFVDEQLRPLQPESFFAVRRPYRSLAGNLFKFGYLGCCMCFRREVLAMALPFPANHHLCTHDNWLFLVASCFFHTKILDEPLIEYRRHGANASDGGLERTSSLFFRLHYRLYLSFHLLWRLAHRP